MGAKIGNLNKKTHLKLSTCELFRSLRQERDWYGLRWMFFADQAMVFFLLVWSFNSPFDQSAMNLVHHTLFYLFAPPYSLFLLGKGRKHCHSFKEMECMWQSSKFYQGASRRKICLLGGRGVPRLFLLILLNLLGLNL